MGAQCKFSPWNPIGPHYTGRSLLLRGRQGNSKALIDDFASATFVFPRLHIRFPPLSFSKLHFTFFCNYSQQEPLYAVSTLAQDISSGRQFQVPTTLAVTEQS